MPTKTTHYSVVIVGGGQSGLSLSHCLQQRGIDHLVIEKRSAGAHLAHAALGFVLPGHAQLAVQAAGLAVHAATIRTASWSRTRSTPGSPASSSRCRRRLLEGVTVEKVSTRRRGRRASRSRPAPAASPPTRWWWPRAAITSPWCRAWPSGCRPAIVQIPLGAVPQPGAAAARARCWWWARGQSGAQIAEDLHLAGRKVVPGHRQRAALRALLPRQGRGRLAGRHELLRHAGDRSTRCAKACATTPTTT